MNEPADPQRGWDALDAFATEGGTARHRALASLMRTFLRKHGRHPLDVTPALLRRFDATIAQRTDAVQLRSLVTKLYVRQFNQGHVGAAAALAAGAEQYDVAERFAPLREFAAGHDASLCTSTMRKVAAALDQLGRAPREITAAEMGQLHRQLTEERRPWLQALYRPWVAAGEVAPAILIATRLEPLDVCPRFAALRRQTADYGTEARESMRPLARFLHERAPDATELTLAELDLYDREAIDTMPNSSRHRLHLGRLRDALATDAVREADSASFDAEPRFAPLREQTAADEAPATVGTLRLLAEFADERGRVPLALTEADVKAFVAELEQRFNDPRRHLEALRGFLRTQYARREVTADLLLAAGTEALREIAQFALLREFDDGADVCHGTMRRLASFLYALDRHPVAMSADDVAAFVARMQATRPQPRRDRLWMRRFCQWLQDRGLASHELAIAAGADPWDADPQFAPLRAFAEAQQVRLGREVARALARWLTDAGIRLDALTAADVAAFDRRHVARYQRPAKVRSWLRRLYCALALCGAVAPEVAVATGAEPIDVHPRCAELRRFARRRPDPERARRLRAFARFLFARGTDPIGAASRDVTAFLDEVRQLGQVEATACRVLLRSFYVRRWDDERIAFELRWAMGVDPLHLSPARAELEAFRSRRAHRQKQVVPERHLAAFGLIHGISPLDLGPADVERLHAFLDARFSKRTVVPSRATIAAFYRDLLERALAACDQADDEDALACAACGGRARRLLATATAATAVTGVGASDFGPERDRLHEFRRMRPTAACRTAMNRLAGWFQLRGKVPLEATAAELAEFYADLSRSDGLTQTSIRNEVRRYYAAHVDLVGVTVAAAAAVRGAWKRRPGFESLRDYLARLPRHLIAAQILDELGWFLSERGVAPLDVTQADLADFRAGADESLSRRELRSAAVRSFYRAVAPDVADLWWARGDDPIELSPDRDAIVAYLGARRERLNLTALRHLAAYGIAIRRAPLDMTVSDLQRLPAVLGTRMQGKAIGQLLPLIAAFLAEQLEAARADFEHGPAAGTARAADLVAHRLSAAAVHAPDPIAISPERDLMRAFVRARGSRETESAMRRIARFFALRGAAPLEAIPSEFGELYAELERTGRATRTIDGLRNEIGLYVGTHMAIAGVHAAMAAGAPGILISPDRERLETFLAQRRDDPVARNALNRLATYCMRRWRKGPLGIEPVHLATYVGRGMIALPDEHQRMHRRVIAQLYAAERAAGNVSPELARVAAAMSPDRDSY
jgi:hypothetical protein